MAVALVLAGLPALVTQASAEPAAEAGSGCSKQFTKPRRQHDPGCAKRTIVDVSALAGDAASVRRGSEPYRHPQALYDVTSGANGSCGGGYLCTAKAGYDGPSGLGTPNGAGAF